ncbi:hypothetical protein, partial [Halalkalicoccus sp. NIPERK01]|uniref:hypothetical protein n=1 Tax=Halalkalicoccus sp. NIPERK01 TaxID=3053469 RepID=UPI00256E9B5E
ASIFVYKFGERGLRLQTSNAGVQYGLLVFLYQAGKMIEMGARESRLVRKASDLADDPALLLLRWKRY